MDENEMLYDDSKRTELDSQPKVQKIQGIGGVNEVDTLPTVSSATSLNLGTSYDGTTKTRATTTRTYASAEAEDKAKNQAELDIATGVEHTLDEEEKEDYLSTKELYEKTLGVTQYDELRAKLHLRDDESFTDYYNRTGYIPKGFERQAQLLLAEEKRKKLYAEVEAGNMSEEDFLYEAYGKDLLKQDGVDFSSSLYWYRKYKSGDYSDPRENDTYMLQLIEHARSLFMQEKWYETATTKDITNISQYVTGEVLEPATVAKLFPEFFGAMDEYYEQQTQLIKFYRSGMLQGFDPTIDADGDGKIDYFYATDGKLYNVNETGQGANTVKAVYNDDGSLNRITFSDSGVGEIASSFFGGLARFFTEVIDLGAMAIGAVVDAFDGGGYGDTLADWTSTMGQFWNSIPVVGDRDYVVDGGWTTDDGKTNWMNIGRETANFIGYIIPTIVLTIVTWGGSAGGQAAGQAVKTGAIEGTKAAVKTVSAKAAKKVAKEVAEEAIETVVETTAKKAAKKIAKEAAEEAVKKLAANTADDIVRETAKKAAAEAVKNISKEAVKQTAKSVTKVAAKEVTEEVAEGVITNVAKNTVKKITFKSVADATGKGIKAVGNTMLKTGMSLTKLQSGFSFGLKGTAGLWARRVSGAALAAARDSLQVTAQLNANKHLGLSDGEIVAKSLGFGAINFASGVLLRSVGDQSALRSLASLGKGGMEVAATNFMKNQAPTVWRQIALNSFKSGGTKAAILGANMVLDGLDNVITTALQTSLTTDGTFNNWEAMGRALTSPKFIANMAYQGYNSAQDMYRITPEKIAAASIESVDMEQDVRNFIKGRIAIAEQNGDAAGASALNTLLREFDDDIQRLTTEVNDTPIKYLLDKEGKEIEGGGRTLQSRLEDMAKKKESKKVSQDQKGIKKAEKLQSEANDIRSEKEVTYSKAEAILKAINNLADKINISDAHPENEMSDLFRAWGDRAKNSISRTVIATNAAIFRQAHENHVAYIKLADSFWGGGVLAKTLYGKASQDFQITMAQSIYRAYYNRNLLDQYSIEEQIANDIHDSANLYNRLVTNLEGSGVEEMKNAKLQPITDFKEKLDGDGKPVLNKAGVPVYNIEMISDNLSEPGANKFYEYWASKTKDEQHEIFDDIHLSFPRTGGEHDGTPEFSNAVKYAHIVYKFWDAIAGENSPIVKLDDNNYIIRSSFLGMTLNNAKDAGLLFRSLCNLKTALASEKSYETDAIATAVRYFFGVLGNKESDVDTAIEDNYNLLPDFINALASPNTDMKQKSVFTKRDLVAIVNALDKHIMDYNAKNPTKKIQLPSSTGSNDTYDEVLRLKQFNSDYARISAIVIDAGKDNVSIDSKDVKEIRNFLHTYVKAKNEGGRVYDSRLEEAINAELITVKDVARLQQALDFIVGKTSSTLASIKSQKLESSSETSNNELEQGKNNVTINDFVEYEEQEYFNTRLDRHTKTTSKESRVSIDIREIGTTKDFKGYLASLGLDEDINAEVRSAHYDNYIEDTVEAIRDHYRIAGLSDNERVLEEIRDSLSDLNKRPDDKRHLNKLQRRIEKLSNDYEYQLDLSIENAKRIDEASTSLNNKTRTAVFNFNQFITEKGAKIQRNMYTNSAEAEAAFKAESDQARLKILLGTPKAISEWNSQQHKLDYYRRKFGAFKEVPVDSKLFDTIMEDLGYNGAAYRYQNGEQVIPGLYWNNDTKGAVITGSAEEKYQLLEYIDLQINLERAKRLKQNKEFKDPLLTIKDASEGLTFIDDEIKLRPDAIILNTLSKPEEFYAAIQDAIEYHEINVKKGKNAGARFKQLLTAMRGIGVSSSEDADLAKALDTYKIVNTFAELYDEPTLFQEFAIDRLTADTLNKNFKGLYITTNIPEDPTRKLITINPSKTKEDFTKQVFAYIKRNGLESLNKILPIEYITEGELHNNLTRHERTNINSAYTPLTWLEENLDLDFDIYDFTSKYAVHGLDLKKGLDISTEAYDTALKYFQNKSKQDVIDDTKSGLDDNIFYVMHKNAYVASNKMAEAYVEAIEELLPDADGYTITSYLGNSSFRKNLGQAIRSVLMDQEVMKHVSMSDGFINTDNEVFLNAIIKVYNDNYTEVHTSKNQSDSFSRNMNSVTGLQLQSLNPAIGKLDLDSAILKDILTIAPLEYSDIAVNDSTPIVAEKIKAMLLASSMNTDSLNISTKDLYDLSPEERQLFLSFIPEKYNIKDLETLLKYIDESAYYKSLYSSKSLVERMEVKDIPLPAMSERSGEYAKATSKGNIELSKFQRYIEKLENNAKGTYSKDLYLKLSEALNTTTQNNRVLKQLSKELELYVTPYVNNAGSLQYQNLTIAENAYNRLRNMTDWANALIEYGFKKEAVIPMARAQYMYSTGMQMQGAHPEFLIFDKTTGKVVDIAMSGSKSDIDDGLIVRLYNDYFETITNEDGTVETKFKKSFVNRLSAEDPIIEEGDFAGEKGVLVQPENLVAIRLNRNQLSTTFNDVDTEIDIYEFKDHEQDFKYMILDKIKAIANANKLSLQKQDDIAKIQVESSRWFHDREYANTVGFNKKLIKEGAYLYGNSAQSLITTLDQLSFLTDMLTRAENSVNKHTQENLKAKNQAETDLNDILNIGTTRQELINTDGAQEFISDVNKNLKGLSLSIADEMTDTNKQLDMFTRTKEDILDDIKIFKSIKRSKYSKHQKTKLDTTLDILERQLQDTNAGIYELRKGIQDIYATMIDVFRDEGEDSPLFKEFANYTKKFVANKSETESSYSDEVIKQNAINAIKTYIRTDKSAEADAFKITGSDLDILRNRKFENYININSENIKIDESMFNSNVLGIDIETFYNKESGKQHVFEITLHYVKPDGTTSSVTKYIKDPKVTGPESLAKEYPDYYKEYYNDKVKGPGSKKAFNAYMNSADNTSEFDAILKLASDNGALLFGYNSKQYDIRMLTESGILDDNNPIHHKLLARHVDVFDIVKSIKTSENIDLHGGRATLEAVAEQLGINLKDSHYSLADITGTLEVLKAIVNKSITTYESDIVSNISKIFTSLTGMDFEQNYSYIRQAIKDSGINYTDVADAYSEHLGKLHTHLTNTFDSPEHYNRTATMMQSIIERDTINRTNTLIRYINDQLNLNVNSNYIRFADEFAVPKIKEEFINAIAFKLDYITSGKSNDTKSYATQVQQELQNIADTLSPSYGESTLINSLITNKNFILEKLGINKEEFEAWKKDNAYNSHIVLQDAFNKTYGKDLANSVNIDNTNITLSYSLKPIAEYIDKSLNFLSDEDKILIKQLSTNLFNYKGEWKKMSEKPKVDLFSNMDKALMEYYLTDPVLVQGATRIYRLAQSSIHEVNLNSKYASDPKNLNTLLKSRTIYMTESDYRELMGYEEGMDIGSPANVYIPVIRYPMDKFDSIHGFKVSIIDDNETIKSGVNLTSLLSLLNGDADGDKLELLRPDSALNAYLKKVDEAGKYAVYDILDEIVKNSYPYIKKEIDPKDNQHMLAINTDKDVAQYVLKDIYKLQNGRGDYQTMKKKFIQRFGKTYPEKLLDKMYIHEGIDVSDKIYGYKNIYYSNLVSLAQNANNVLHKRAYTIAQMAEYGVLNYADTQTGMFQKGFLYEDYSKYGNISLIDNIIRLDDSTRTTLDLVDDITKVLPTTILKDSRFKKLINNSEIPNSTKVETILRVQQYEKLNSKEYTTAIAKAVKELKDTPSKFTDAYKRFVKDETGEDFFRSISKIVDLKKQTSEKFSFAKSKEIKNSLEFLNAQQLPVSESYYSPGIKANVVYDLYAQHKQGPDMTQYIGWTDKEGKAHGANAIRKINARNTKELSNKTVNHFASYNKMQRMTESDVRSLGVGYNKYCNYFYVSTNNNIITYVTAFNMDVAKSMTKGSGGTKSTPTSTITDLSKLGNKELQTIIEQNNVVQMRSFKDTFKPEKINTDYDVLKNGSYIMYDNTGKVTTDPYQARYIVMEETLLPLEASIEWNQSSKETIPLEESAIGNNILSTGGIGITHGIFVKEQDGNIVIDEDMDQYRKLNALIDTTKDSDRYIADGTDFYEKLAVGTIIKNLDPSDIEGSKTEYYKKIIAGDARKFINTHRKKIMSKNLTPFEKRLLSPELYTQVYGKTGVTVNPDILYLNSKSGKGVDSNTIFYKAKSNIKGTLNDMYKLNDSPNMSTIEVLNYLNKGHSFISNKVAKDAEMQNLLLNRKINTDEVDYSQFSNNQYKRAQIFNGPIESTPSENGVMKDLVDDASYYDNYNFEGSINLNTKMSKAYEGIDSDASKTIKGKRLASLVNSLLNTEGTYKSRDTIIQSLSPDLTAIMSMAVPTITFKPNGHVDYAEKRISLGPKGYTELPLSKARAEVYNQQRSPYYWDSNNIFNSNHQELNTALISMPDLRNLDTDDTLAESPEFKKLVSDLGVSDPNSYKEKLLGAMSEYQNKLIEVGISEEQAKEMTPTRYQGEIISGRRVGSAQFTERKFGLNNGLALDSTEALEQDRNIHQIRADSDYTVQKYATQLGVIDSLVKRDNCAGEFRLFAYVTALQTKLDTISAKDNPAAIDDIKLRLADLGINDGKKFIQNFTDKHYTIANRFYTLIKDLDTECSKYSQVTNEPGKNIYFLLTPKTSGKYSENNQKAKTVVNMLQRSYLDEDGIPAYDSYDVIDSLTTTIQGVANRSAIYNNAQRLKQQGVIDSYEVQNIIAETFNGEKVRELVRNSSSKNKFDAEQEKQTLDLVSNRLSERFNDSELSTRLEKLMDKVYPDSKGRGKQEMTITMGEAYLEMLDIISSYTSKFKVSLDDALELANTNNGSDFDSIIYGYRQMQDVVSRLFDFCPEIKNSIFEKLSTYSKENNVSFVDKYGRLFDKDNVYSLSDTSLEFIPKVLNKYKMSYEDDVIMSALTGNLFFMDSALANTFAEKVFVKRPLKKYQKVLASTARWGVKMIMSMPLKVIDRFAKFTMFDAAALNTANHNTFFNQPKAYKDLRAYFSSKGGYASEELDEFLKTQGVRLDGQSFDGIISGDDTEAGTGGVFKTYTDATGNLFTFQTLSQRYAYWLATKKAIEKGDYSTLGPAYHLASKLKNSNMTAGEQASFALAQTIGSVNDFPAISKTFSKYGFVFTTFPMAAIRWGVGELKSAGAAIQDLFTSGLKGAGAKWIARNSVGLAATYAIEQLLINVICSMYGVDEDDERQEEWEKVGAMPNITQTLIQGQPIMDTFSSMSVPRSIADLFITTKTNTDDEEGMSGLKRFLLKNVVGHMNPIVKSAGEVLLKKDLIDDQVIDTSNKYSGMENVFRKVSSYFLGSAGANAATKELFKDGDYSLSDRVSSAATRAMKAELGNTKAIKENRKNYYKTIQLINEYIYADVNSDTEFSENTSFNRESYDLVKSTLYSLINNEASSTEVYQAIHELINTGYGLAEIKSALKNVSVSGKLAKLDSYDDFISSLTSSELQNVKTALAYEQYMFPWLEDNLNLVSNQLRETKKYSNTYMPSYYTVNYNYNYYTPQNYTINTSSYNYRNNKRDVFDTYSQMLKDQEYQRQQAEYARKRKQWEVN